MTELRGRPGRKRTSCFLEANWTLWRSSLLSSTPLVIQWCQSPILSHSLICAWLSFKARSREGEQGGSPDLTALTLGLRNVSEFHKERQVAVLALQRSLRCKAQGKSRANSLPGRWWGLGKGKSDVFRRVGWREPGTSLDSNGKKYLGRGQL